MSRLVKPGPGSIQDKHIKRYFKHNQHISNILLATPKINEILFLSMTPIQIYFSVLNSW